MQSLTLENLDKNSDPSYIHALFGFKDVLINALVEARKKKIDKHDPIVNETKTWLQENLEGIRIKHKASNVDFKFIFISNPSIVSKETERDIAASLIMIKRRD
jgi:hypothetical protein